MLYNDGMATTIAQRKLRNEMPDVLRRVEQGERFTVTVNGRPTAELGPLVGAREPATLADLASIIEGAPVDASWTQELLSEREEDEAVTVDPWAP
jgi:prevent-host-death family protein